MTLSFLKGNIKMKKQQCIYTARKQCLMGIWPEDGSNFEQFIAVNAGNS